MFERSFERPSNYFELSTNEQWDIEGTISTLIGEYNAAMGTINELKEQLNKAEAYIAAQEQKPVLTENDAYKYYEDEAQEQKPVIDLQPLEQSFSTNRVELVQEQNYVQDIAIKFAKWVTSNPPLGSHSCEELFEYFITNVYGKEK